MQLPPASILSNWPTPNYDNPHTQGPALVIVNVIFMTLISIAVPLRLYGRYTVKGRLGWDDFNMAIAYIFSMALGVVVIAGNLRYQWNRHLWDVEFTMFQSASIVALLAKVLFSLAATFGRASLICFYFRLIKDTGYSVYKWILRATFAYNIAIGVTFVCLSIFLCTPVEAYWVFPLMKNAKCLSEGITTLIPGALNCVTDLLVTFLPVPIIMRLNMPLKQRIGVTVLLSLGLVVTVAGVIRTYYIWRTLMGTYDETWDSFGLYISAAVEIDLAVLCGCAPALKPLFAPLVSHVTQMISSVGHQSGSGQRSTKLQDTTITRSTVISQKCQARAPKEGDKIPLTLITVGDRSADDSGDEQCDNYQISSVPASTCPKPAQRPLRSPSNASSQRAMLRGHCVGGPSAWDIEEGYEKDDTIPEICPKARHQGADADIDLEKGNWNTDWRLSKGVKAGWVGLNYH